MGTAKVIENESRVAFEEELNEYLEDGYVIESSSCNSRTWKAILVKEEHIYNLGGELKGFHLVS